MSADLSAARQFVKEARRTAGRKPEHQFRDLCKAVERIIAHLEKLEKASLQRIISK
jgi:vacuolar-type H+-ATPase subunit E/Vma4